MLRVALFWLASTLLAGCYLSHERPTDAGLIDAAAPCERPMLWYPFDDDFENHGSAGHIELAREGRSATFVPGLTGSAAALPNRSSLRMEDTARLLAAAPALTFSVWVQVEEEAEGRSVISCRSYDRGFHTYPSYGGLTTCAGDGFGPPRGWGACATASLPRDRWTHFVLRWEGVGSEPELTTNGTTWQSLTASDDFPLEADFDLFGDEVVDLEVGVDAGDGGLGSMMVDDLRVYDVALPRETAWATTSCPL